MSTSAISGASGSSNTSSSGDSLQAFRNADFLKIMMAEVTNQDPLQPSDTSKMVDNLQKLQDLANSTYAKFRADIKWANDLMGQTVQVQQQSIDEKKSRSQTDKGLKPDVGFGLVNGRIDNFRVLDQQVWISVRGHDYPIDNLKQIVPEARQGEYLSQMADQLLGKNVGYKNERGEVKGGMVSAVKYDDKGSLQVQIGESSIPFTQVVQIGGTSLPP